MKNMIVEDLEEVLPLAGETVVMNEFGVISSVGEVERVMV